MFLQSTSCTCNPSLSHQVASSVKNLAINLGRKLKKKKKRAFEQPQWMARAQAQSRALGDGGGAPLLSVPALEDFSELELLGPQSRSKPSSSGVSGRDSGDAYRNKKEEVQMSFAVSRTSPSICSLWDCTVSCLPLPGPLPCSLCGPASSPSSGPRGPIT